MFRRSLQTKTSDAVNDEWKDGGPVNVNNTRGLCEISLFVSCNMQGSTPILCLWGIFRET